MPIPTRTETCRICGARYSPQPILEPEELKACPACQSEARFKKEWADPRKQEQAKRRHRHFYGK